MKPVDIKSGTHVFGVENNDKDPKFKFDDNARISNYSYNPYCPEKKLKLYHGHDLWWAYYVNIVIILWKRVADQTDQRELNVLVGMWKLNWIYLVMQQKLIEND